MCTNFEYSMHRVLSLLEEGQPLTVQDVRRRLGLEALKLTLGPTPSLEQFFRTLESERLLDHDEEQDTYRLSARGEDLYHDLTEKVRSVQTAHS